MKTIDLNDNPHTFSKQNLVTQMGNFDTLKCDKCGIQGKTTSLSTMSVKESYSKDVINNCTQTEDVMRNGNKGRKIIITHCSASGPAFTNITDRSEHTVIETPKEHKPNSRGVWVMGTGEPIMVLNNEFNYKK
jgi:hypothetical protein